ncbi:MAG: putative oxidoreductase [Thermomicrobiales bacterium]|nr:putative oxidoreductase [Thermomicrobiales bacterium]
MADMDDMKAQLCGEERTRRADLGLLVLRLTAGGLLAGHGAQKLFGAFGGHGLEGTAGWLESIGLRPGKTWAVLAGASEFGGGTLTALGLGGPLGPIAMQGAMATAARKAHWGKPIWATAGGAEVPVLYSAIGAAVGLAGPGRYSLDRLFGVRVPKTLVALTMAGVAAGITLADRQSAPATPEEPAPEEAVMEGPKGGEDRVVEARPGAEAPVVGGAPQTGATSQTGDDAGTATDATAASALSSI